MMDATCNVFKRMSLITNEIQTVAKNIRIKAGGTTYKAVGEVDVLDSVKPLEEKYGIYSYPVSRKTLYLDILHTEEPRWNSEKKIYETVKKVQFIYRVETTYRFVNVDNPSDYIDIVSYGDGIDTGDKAPGKAMTYADKYALLKAYKIQTGDDPDKNASPEFAEYKQNTPPPQPSVHSAERRPEPEPVSRPVVMATPEQVTALLALYDENRRISMMKYHGISSLDQLSADVAQKYINVAAKKREAGNNG